MQLSTRVGRHRLLDTTYVLLPSATQETALRNHHLCPECDSLADGTERHLREDGKQCECKEGWGGINCNGLFSLFLHATSLFDYPPVCQSDNSCANFPIRGDITNLDASDSVNMTCYKGGETVFNNHQFCDVTSAHILRLRWKIITPATQTAKFLICYLVVLPRSPSAATRPIRHAISNFGQPRSSHFTAHSIRARRR